MKVLLVRTNPQNILARLGTLHFEPLELEYLMAAARGLNHTCQIYDGLLEKRQFASVLQEYEPDVVAITGYSIHVNKIREYAGKVKEWNPCARVIVGGVHAELNWEDFYHPNIDVVVHANPLRAFKQILQAMVTDFDPAAINNICVKTAGGWQKNMAERFDPDELPLPDRSHLLANQRRFRYFGKEECALVKTAWGCGFECSFCYCARLNGGRYQVRNIAKVVEEIAALPQQRIFIIDDNFLAAKARVLEFCNLIEAYQIQKNFSVYGRADFICANAAILPRLREAGIDEVIVGLESIDDKTLQSYNKQVSADTNLQAVKLLHEHGISTCGLFIVGQDYGVEDFRQLARTVKQMKLANCMFSIFTPLKGVPGYEEYQERLVSPPDFFENLDFLHLTLRPGKLSVARFYFEFYRLYAVAYLDWYRIKHNALPLLRSLQNLALENISRSRYSLGRRKKFGG